MRLLATVLLMGHAAAWTPFIHQHLMHHRSATQWRRSSNNPHLKAMAFADAPLVVSEMVAASEVRHAAENETNTHYRASLTTSAAPRARKVYAPIWHWGIILCAHLLQPPMLFALERFTPPYLAWASSCAFRACAVLSSWEL